jgi:hypothetical protein
MGSENTLLISLLSQALLGLDSLSWGTVDIPLLAVSKTVVIETKIFPLILMGFMREIAS